MLAIGKFLFSLTIDSLLYRLYIEQQKRMKADTMISGSQTKSAEDNLRALETKKHNVEPACQFYTSSTFS